LVLQTLHLGDLLLKALQQCFDTGGPLFLIVTNDNHTDVSCSLSTKEKRELKRLADRRLIPQRKDSRDDTIDSIIARLEGGDAPVGTPSTRSD